MTLWSSQAEGGRTFDLDRAQAQLQAAGKSANDLMGRLVELLVKTLPGADPILLVGGFVRDLLREPEAKPKDIDITLGNIEAAAIAACLPQATRNFFGGFTFSFDGRVVDLWPLTETYHIKHFGLPATIHNLLNGAPLNLDKIAFDIRAGHLYDDGCLAGLAQKVISYHPARPYLEHIQAARCILLRRKTKFRFDESIYALLRRANEALEKNPEMRPEIDDYLRYLKQFKRRSSRNQVVNEILTAASTSTTNAAPPRPY